MDTFSSDSDKALYLIEVFETPRIMTIIRDRNKSIDQKQNNVTIIINL